MWLVCTNRDESEYSIMTRGEREVLLDTYMELGDGVPTRVLKTFHKKKDAKKYVKEMKLTNIFIDKL
jgi:hypothetical protein